MQGEALFHSLAEFQSQKRPPAYAFRVFLGPRGSGRGISQQPSKAASDGHFGEDVHAANLGRNPKLGTFLDSNDRGLAADPALLP
jgi:hypothetical protein